MIYNQSERWFTMTIKMIAVDMDGTFLNDKKEYNFYRFKKIFKDMEDKNIKFVVASGNQYFQLRSFFPSLYKSITFVAENGANIVCGNTPFYNAEISKKDVGEILDVIYSLNPTNVILCGKNSAYISSKVGEQQYNAAKFYYPKMKKVENLYDVIKEKDEVVKVALSFEKEEVQDTLQKLNSKLAGKLLPVSSGHGDIDLIVPGIHKLHGIRLLGQKWGIKDNEIATFGDSGNDLEMIKYIENSYAMKNAQPAIKNAATTIIGSNNSETVLDTIEQIINS